MPATTVSETTTFAPRAGFAYDFKGDGRSRLYGSFGIFYDAMKLEMPRGSFGGERWIERYYTLDTPNWQAIGDGNYPGTFIESVDWRSTAIERGLLDPDIEPMRSHEFTLGFDKQVGNQASVGVRYVHKRLDRTIEDVGVLGATGMVGQQFVLQLDDHPWFQLTWLAASERSEGKRYREAAPWRLPSGRRTFSGRATRTPTPGPSSLQPPIRF